jgi:hypothetical protein
VAVLFVRQKDALMGGSGKPILVSDRRNMSRTAHKNAALKQVFL